MQQPLQSKPADAAFPARSDDADQLSLSQSMATDSATSPKTDVISDIRMSPDWDETSLKYMKRNTFNGAYTNLLNVLQEWKNDDAAATRIAAFMTFDDDIKPFPAFGGHTTYRRKKDTPLRIVFFGEVAPANAGTALGARGNHYPGTVNDVHTSLTCAFVNHTFSRGNI